MCLDIASNLLAEGDVLSQGTVEDLVKGLDVRRHSLRTENHKPIKKCILKCIFVKKNTVKY